MESHARNGIVAEISIYCNRDSELAQQLPSRQSSKMAKRPKQPPPNVSAAGPFRAGLTKQEAEETLLKLKDAAAPPAQKPGYSDAPRVRTYAGGYKLTPEEQLAFQGRLPEHERTAVGPRLLEGIVALMRKREMNQKDLAKAIGANTSTVSRLLSGKRRLDSDVLSKICLALDIDAINLLTGGHVETRPEIPREFREVVATVPEESILQHTSLGPFLEENADRITPEERALLIHMAKFSMSWRPGGDFNPAVWALFLRWWREMSLEDWDAKLKKALREKRD